MICTAISSASSVSSGVSITSSASSTIPASASISSTFGVAVRICVTMYHCHLRTDIHTCLQNSTNRPNPVLRIPNSPVCPLPAVFQPLRFSIVCAETVAFSSNGFGPLKGFSAVLFFFRYRFGNLLFLRLLLFRLKSIIFPLYFGSD